jgi:hypothetical protein
MSSLRVNGCPADYLTSATGVPPIAADLLQRPSGQSRAKSGHSYLGAEASDRLRKWL